MKINKNMAIHCKTKEEAQQLIEYLTLNGLQWYETSAFGEYSYDAYKENTCYCISDSGNCIQYSGIGYFMTNMYNIICFEKFIKNI